MELAGAGRSFAPAVCYVFDDEEVPPELNVGMRWHW